MPTIDGSLIEPDSIPANRISTTDTGLQKSQISQRPNQKLAIPLTAFRVHDAVDSPLPGTPPDGQDDLGLISPTWGTDSLTLQSEDVKGDGATNKRAAVEIVLPDNYEDGETVTIRVRAAMEGKVADTSATIDLEAYKPDGTGAVGSDLCATAAADMNSLTPADFDFTITPTGLVAGDILDVRLTAAINDAASGTAVVAAIYEVSLLADLR